MKKAFTLIELLVVVAIMGLLGTVSVGGYRAMQRGMEERGVMQNVNQFIRSAYQRAQIDRQPVAVFFWNETLREETDYSPPVVIGRAVAVRRAGRITAIVDKDLCDEFGDLRFNRLVLNEDDDEEGEVSENRNNAVALYPMNGPDDPMEPSLVSQNTVKFSNPEKLLLGSQNETADIEAYAYHVIDQGGVSWKNGYAYGFEFAEIQLPHNFIFGQTYSKSASSPVAGRKRFFFEHGVSTSESIDVRCLRPNRSGELSPEPVASSDSPTQSMR